MENKEWNWDGTIWEFVDVIKWSLVFRRLGREKPEGWTDIVNDPDLVKKKAAEYGMNEWTISKEMVRIGTDAIKMLEIAEQHRGRD